MSMDQLIQSLNQYPPVPKAIQHFTDVLRKSLLCQHQTYFQQISKGQSLINSNQSLIKYHQLKQDIDFHMKQAQQAHAQISKLNQYITHIQEDKARTQKMLDQVSRQVAQQGVSLSVQTNQILKLQEDNLEISKKYNALHQQYSSLTQQLKGRNNELSDKMNRLNDYEAKLRERQKQLQEKLFLLQSCRDPLAKQAAKSVLMQEDFHIQRRQVPKTAFKKISKHHDKQIYSTCFNNNGTVLASCGGDRAIKLFSVIQRKTICTAISDNTERYYLKLCFLGYGQKLAAGCTDSTIQIFSAAGKTIGNLLGHTKKVNTVSYLGFRQSLISGSEDRQLKTWDILKSQPISSINCDKSILSCSSSSQQPKVVVGLNNGSIRIYSVTEKSSLVSEIKNVFDYGVNYVNFLENKNDVMACSKQGTAIKIFDLRNNKEKAVFQHAQFINNYQHFAPTVGFEGKFIIAGNYDGKIYHWRRDTQQVLDIIAGHQGRVTVSVYSGLTGVLATADQKGSLMLWN